MEYVYKYLNGKGDVVYVGITKDIKRRIAQHKVDKLAEINNPMIYYFPVKYRGDAEMLETYLIDFYRTSRFYNVAKTRKGKFSFLDICDELPWVVYDGKEKSNLKPFVVSDVVEISKAKEIIVEKKIYVDKFSSDEQILINFENEINKLKEKAQETFDFENTICDLLLSYAKNNPKNEIFKKGFYLHNKRKKAVYLLKERIVNHYKSYSDTKRKRQEWDKLVYLVGKIQDDIEKFESNLKQ